MRILLIIMSLLVVLVSCSYNDSNGSGDLFSIKVVDVDGNPVSGLFVGVNNAEFNDYNWERLNTRISISSEQNCNCSLKIYDLKNHLIRTLIDTLISEEMLHFNWNVTNNEGESVNIGGTNIFKYEAILTDISSKDIILQDSKYLCYEVGMSATQGQIGTTDENGEFTFNNKLAFPHLFNMGEQPHIDSNGEYIGEFVLSDSINIKLLNTVTDEYLVFTEKMSSNNNHYELVWENPDEFGYQQRNFVYLSSFIAYQSGDLQVHINWETQFEENVSNFELFRNISDNFDTSLLLTTISANGSVDSGASYEYFDNNDIATNTTYFYWIKANSSDGTTILFGPLSIHIEEEPDNPEPPQLWENNLYQNFPNPFN